MTTLRTAIDGTDREFVPDVDYNANINKIVACPPRDRRLNIIKSFYVKFERKIPALIDGFCRYYSGHRIDGSDAFDTLYIGCEKFPFRDSFSLSMSGVL